MKYVYTLFVFCFAFAKAYSQVVINELDTDTPGTDDMEFVELKTDNPFQSLNGYVLVFFNGSTSTSSGQGRSYYTVDLDGLTTDNNGLIVLGSSQVSPVPDRLLAESNIQNGADAVAIYLGDDTDWPDRTFANQTNLIDALVYETDDALNQNLLNLLGETVQYNENENGNKLSESIQRKADGTFEVKPSTPHSLNDTTTPSYTGVSYTTSSASVDEGSSVDITFTLTQASSNSFTLNYSLNNAGFDTSDYTGVTQVTFAPGVTSVTESFTIIDDVVDEGDEFMRINIQNSLPVGFKRLKDNETVLIVDNDFQIANYGTPLQPTYGIVNSTAPSNYYDSLNNLSGNTLETAITNLIADENTVRIHTYDDTIEILKQADVSPLNSNKVWLLYSEEDRSDILFQTGSSNVGRWNREHIYPRSRGGFFEIEYDETIDGMSAWTPTNADSLRHGQSDAHHLRATDGPENSQRGNKDYPEYNGPSGSQGSWHGDVARAIFYMTLRYNGLDVVNGNPSNSTSGQIGDLATLLQWHRNDPPDDFEMNRNNVVYNWQFNRNPFIDLPDLVEYIWGNQSGQTYLLNEDEVSFNEYIIYPNPSQNSFLIQTTTPIKEVAIYDGTGRWIQNKTVENNSTINHNLQAGVYYLKITSTEGNTSTIKHIVK
ncbi:endonuclease I [Nonlabens tegetincola]|uniref:endonuclease n=1 Tax=Nonlabens tegetincola TaxID=323273 RepID=UPI000A20A1D2|nr:endonuclease [Nonlabens tegetincola]ARN70710.1 endonuclease I [Nonlabens tegetincola]